MWRLASNVLLLQTQHGSPGSMERHAGDLGNIVANENGVADVEILIPRGTSLFGNDALTIFGRSIVIHQKEDDGSVPKHGNAGRIMACGIVEKKTNTIIPPMDTSKEAFVTISPHLNRNSIGGNVKISQNTPTSPLVIKGSIEGLMPGKHGIHIHQLKTKGNDCTTSGGHFNPGNVRFKKNLSVCITDYF